MARFSAPGNSRALGMTELINKFCQELIRRLQPDKNTFYLFIPLLQYKLNTTIRKSQKFTSFESFFGRTNDYSVVQFPELSKTAKLSYNKNKVIREFIDHTELLRSELDKVLNAKRDRLISNSKPTIKLKSGEFCRIKMKQAKGERKKFFRPFSKQIWKIKSVNPHTKSCIIQEVVSEEGIRPKLRRCALRFLKRVHKLPKGALGDSDFEPEVEPENVEINLDLISENEASGNETSEVISGKTILDPGPSDSEQSKSKNPKGKNGRKMKNKKNSRKLKIIQQKHSKEPEAKQEESVRPKEKPEKQKAELPSTHRMTLRSRKK